MMQTFQAQAEVVIVQHFVIVGPYLAAPTVYRVNTLLSEGVVIW